MHIEQVFAGEGEGVVTIMSGQVRVKAIQKVPISISPENVTPDTNTTVRMRPNGIVQLELAIGHSPRVCTMHVGSASKISYIKQGVTHKEQQSAGGRTISRMHATTLRTNAKLLVSQITFSITNQFTSYETPNTED